MKKCGKCKMVKDEREFYRSSASKDGLQLYCKDCSREVCKIHCKSNRESYNRNARERLYKHGTKPMSENTSCPSYLGCYINERILKHVMPNAILMNYANPGYDLMCGKGYLVDAKSSTLQYPKNQSPRWCFNINHNMIPDYFLLTAYKDLESLEICCMWLIPGIQLNDKQTISISSSTIEKWNDWEIDHTDALNCISKIGEIQ